MILLRRIFSPENLRHLAHDCSGATQIEYSLIVALVAVAVLSGASEVGTFVSAVFAKSSQSITQAAGTVQGVGGGSNGACGPGNGNGNCANSGNGGGNTGGSGTGTGNGGQNNGQGGNSNSGGGGFGSGS